MPEDSRMEKTAPHQKGGVFSCIPSRYVVAAMCFSGIMLQYTIKVTLSVVIVAMVRPVSSDTSKALKLQNILSMALRSEEEELDVCPYDDDSDTDSQDGEFEWDEETQGYVLSAYYYGYVATQLLGGRLSEILGSKLVLGPGVLIAGIVTVLSPLAARLHVSAFIAARVLVGAASGLVIPSMYNVLPKWFIKEERSFIGSVIMTGLSVGTIISMIVSGYLVEIGDWPLVFYFFGGISIVFIVPWMFFMYDTPQKHPRVSDNEKDFILSGTGNGSEEKGSYPVPWFSILTSVPLWAHITMGIAYSWVTFTLLSELPTYLSKILHFNLQESGVLSALPYIFNGVASTTSGYLSQWLRSKGYLSHLTAYRLFDGICGLGSAACFLGITFVNCDSTTILVLLVLAMISNGIFYGGSYLNHVDLGSNFAGTTSGIMYTAMNSMGIISPSVTGALTNGKQTLSQWRIVFYISTAIGIVCWLVYMFFGKVEEQPWNKIPSEKEVTEDSPEKTKTKETV